MDFMDEALQEAYEGIEHGHGGPFGSVIVKNGTIVGRGHNRVVYKKDPTCHGEMKRSATPAGIWTHLICPAATCTRRLSRVRCALVPLCGQIFV